MYYLQNVTLNYIAAMVIGDMKNHQHNCILLPKANTLFLPTTYQSALLVFRTERDRNLLNDHYLFHNHADNILSE